MKQKSRPTKTKKEETKQNTTLSVKHSQRENLEAIAMALAIEGQRGTRLSPLVAWLGDNHEEVIKALLPLRRAELLKPLTDAQGGV